MYCISYIFSIIHRTYNYVTEQRLIIHPASMEGMEKKIFRLTLVT